jgi:hypothetical protein
LQNKYKNISLTAAAAGFSDAKPFPAAVPLFFKNFQKNCHKKYFTEMLIYVTISLVERNAKSIK